MLTRVIALIFVGVILAGACSTSTNGPTFTTTATEATLLPLPARLYNSAAWVREDRIALAYLAPTVGIALSDARGSEIGDVTPVGRPECRGLELRALGRSVGGFLGYAQACDTPARLSVDFALRDLQLDEAQTVGGGTGLPYDASWTVNDTIVYSTGDVLCSTLYRHQAVRDESLSLDVEIEGERFSAGQDLTSLPEGCPVGGRAAFPAHNNAGTSLAFMASSDGDKVDQGLLDRPWTIFVTSGGVAVPLLADLQDPRDLTWATDERLLFAARLDGNVGLWSVKVDASDLTLVSEVDALDLAVSPAGDRVVAILSGFEPGGAALDKSEVAVVELSGT